MFVQRVKGSAHWVRKTRPNRARPAVCSTGTGRPVRPVITGSAPRTGNTARRVAASHTVSTVPRLMSRRPVAL